MSDHGKKLEDPLTPTSQDASHSPMETGQDEPPVDQGALSIDQSAMDTEEAADSTTIPVIDWERMQTQQSEPSRELDVAAGVPLPPSSHVEPPVNPQTPSPSQLLGFKALNSPPALVLGVGVGEVQPSTSKVTTQPPAGVADLSHDM